MRWVIAGLAFAAVVGLAVATAAIEADSVRIRQRMQFAAEWRDAIAVELIADRLDYRRMTELSNLVARWLALQAELDAEVRG